MKTAVLIFALFLSACNSRSTSSPSEETYLSKNCETLPSTFASYGEALSIITNANFAITENANTAKSSWIRTARFYSCDNATGFFVIETNNGNYIHKDVPVDVWQQFKAANSFGSFYNANIKNRYRLVSQ